MVTQESMDAIEVLASRGLFLEAHDRAMSMIKAGMESERLFYLAVLCLARAGATSSALSLFRRFQLDNSTDLEVRGLRPRLLKDIALLSRQLHDAVVAGAAYERLWERKKDKWYAINAAAMALLAGQPERSRRWAELVRQLPDSGDYWSAATDAEAALLLAEVGSCRKWLTIANKRAGADLAAKSTTRRQLLWEAALLGVEGDTLCSLEVPNTIHFCGLIPGQAADEKGLRERLAEITKGVGFAFGGLAAGADIVVAEVLLERGAAVTAVLPFPPHIYVEQSVRPAGNEWISRFWACLNRSQLQVVGVSQQDDLDYSLASRRAMGLACLHARQITSRVWQCAVWDRGGSELNGTAADVTAWNKAGKPSTIVESPWPRRARTATAGAVAPLRQSHSVLFSDLHHFSELDDRGLLHFYENALKAAGSSIDRHAPLYRNAWGDAFQLVFADAVAAALCAFELREVFGRFKVASEGTQTNFMPRLALDFGGLHSVFDHAQRAPKFAGRVMTRAARIEPIAPPGVIYSTEAFACEIALLQDSPIRCDYAGQVALAKNFGTLPLYAVRHVKTELSPYGTRFV